jgi:hypothetical protein
MGFAVSAVAVAVAICAFVDLRRGEKNLGYL